MKRIAIFSLAAVLAASADVVSAQALTAASATQTLTADTVLDRLDSNESFKSIATPGAWRSRSEAKNGSRR